uniref:Outer membrane protein A n=1 Tax=Vibrio parahaemolyticus TaxID=670 RepID=A0A1Y1BGR6_VIBPH|nr:outer membrane protein A [Vibrio parahaemolyticus]
MLLLRKEYTNEKNCLALSNLAQAETYIGGKLGYSDFNDACYLNEPCDDESFTVSGHIGYNFNKYVAAESRRW